MSAWRSPLEALGLLVRRPVVPVQTVRHEFSPALGRPVDFDVYLPPDYDLRTRRRYPLLLVNDGQDLPGMQFAHILERLYRRRRLPYLIAVGLYTTHERIREYGTARQPDYKGRGDKAGAYRDFIVTELLPHLFQRFRLAGETRTTAFAGFSLGGLSAFDIAWQYPEIFGTAGVFSGALWWRSSPVDPAAPDADRIMHDIVRSSPGPHDGQRFWFQCGTRDEDSDRNGNGVIDAIDDTLDLIAALKEKGQPERDLRYLEVPGGEHAPPTWAQAMPDFLEWTFGRRR